MLTARINAVVEVVYLVHLVCLLYLVDLVCLV